MQIAAFIAMSFVLAGLVLTCGALAAIAYHLRRAPEGFEDEAGFHITSLGNSPQEMSLPSSEEATAALFKAKSSSPRRGASPDSIGMAIPHVREAH
jgi:hypothetical protein